MLQVTSCWTSCWPAAYQWVDKVTTTCRWSVLLAPRMTLLARRLCVCLWESRRLSWPTNCTLTSLSVRTRETWMHALNDELTGVDIGHMPPSRKITPSYFLVGQTPRQLYGSTRLLTSNNLGWGLPVVVTAFACFSFQCLGLVSLSVRSDARIHLVVRKAFILGVIEWRQSSEMASILRFELTVIDNDLKIIFWYLQTFCRHVNVE